ncbi:transposase [Streptomyces sp. NPDC005336]|uniref:transposase n=1 Tax=Streptomyces sp. NPDC005336 TaxID=3157035 RepID=UPI0033AE53FA
MSLRPKGPGEIPVETVWVARAAFPRGSLAIRVRDELGPLFTDEQFAGLFPSRGKPAWSPGRLAMVVVLPFVEGLTDRQAAEAVRARIDWRFALGLELTDQGFDFSVLSEFRDLLVSADGGRGVLDGVLAAAREKDLLSRGGRARTDSTHVLSSARELNWPELVGETLRAALSAVAQDEPDWLGAHALPDRFTHDATRIEDSRFPRAQSKRAEVGRRIGADGMRLLRMLWADDAPPQLRALPPVETLRQTAGVEGTISQAVQACGLRTSRYRGLAKTSLQHQLAGAAVNLIRIDAWLTGKPHARTRTSPLAALRPAA